MRKWILGGTAAALVATCAAAQRGQALPTECRKEIVQLCGMNRDAIRGCLREKAAQLSDNCKAQLRKRMDSREGGPKVEAAAGAIELSYGTAPLQKLDYWRAKADRAPLVIFVHGGGWKRGDKGNATGQYKAPHYLGQGYAFASVNYRLVPDATVEEQAADIANAVAYLRRDARKLGFDPDRIVWLHWSVPTRSICAAPG
jgi:arylformamidase